MSERTTPTTTDEEQPRIDDRLPVLERLLRDGHTVIADDNDVQQLADDAGIAPENVIDHLRDRNPDVPRWAFTPRTESDYRWTGLPEHEIETPVEDRQSLDEHGFVTGGDV